MSIKTKLANFISLLSRKKCQDKTISMLKNRIQVLEMTQSRIENYLKNIIRVIPASIYWIDGEGVILGANLTHAKIAGFSDPEEVIGKTDYDFAWKDHADDLIKNNRAVMESGIGCQFEEVVALSDGKLHTFLTCKDPLFDKENNVIGIIGVSTDITEFKELQNELLRVKMLNAEAMAQAAHARAIAEEEMRKTIMVLVGDIVHDLRTPLTTIQSATDFLESIFPFLLEIVEEAKELGVTKVGLLNQKSWDYLLNKTPISCMQNSITMLNDFINTTLYELASANKAISSSLTKQDLIKNSSRKVITNMLSVYPFSDEHQRNKIKHDIGSDFHFMGNSILMMKLLFNLIKNAFEQIALNGKGEIIISTDKEENFNLIKVKDTAGGAPPEVVSNFFKGYFTTKKNGTGIGLAFCKQTMLSFGGDIICHSIYGESMEFILKFPVDF